MADTINQEPAWVKPVKIASAVMGVMIIAGLVLLIYGLATGMGRLAEKNATSERIFTYPQGQDFVKSHSGADGTVLLEFKDSDGTTKIFHIDPNNKRVLSVTSLIEGQGFGFND